MRFALPVLLFYSKLCGLGFSIPQQTHVALMGTADSTSSDFLYKEVAMFRQALTLLDSPAKNDQEDFDEPMTLAEYCTGAHTNQEKIAEARTGTRIEANWESYATFYPGVIERRNSDGSVDVLYDDGFR